MLLNLKIFLDILKFTKGPQDLPSRPNLLNIVIIANIIVGLITIDPKIDYLVNVFFALIYIIVTVFEGRRRFSFQFSARPCAESA